MITKTEPLLLEEIPYRKPLKRPQYLALLDMTDSAAAWIRLDSRARTWLRLDDEVLTRATVEDVIARWPSFESHPCLFNRCHRLAMEPCDYGLHLCAVHWHAAYVARLLPHRDYPEEDTLRDSLPVFHRFKPEVYRDVLALTMGDRAVEIRKRLRPLGFVTPGDGATAQVSESGREYLLFYRREWDAYDTDPRTAVTTVTKERSVA